MVIVVERLGVRGMQDIIANDEILSLSCRASKSFSRLEEREVELKREHKKYILERVAKRK